MVILGLLIRIWGRADSHPGSGWSKIAPGAFLFAVTGVLCWELFSGQLVVGGYDTFTYFYPYRSYAAEVIRAGQLPQWNPYLFFGAPFIANIQAAVFYPLNLLFYFLATTIALNWSVIIHLFLASFFTYLWLHTGLAVRWPAATFGGALFGFGGFLGAQVGHLNQLNAAVWLPLALLCYQHAVIKGSLRWVLATGVVLAIQILAGHSQESYMTAVALAACGVFWGLRNPKGPTQSFSDSIRNSVGRFTRAATSMFTAIFRLLASVAIAVSLASVQLLPTGELMSLSIRSGGITFSEAVSFSLPPTELLAGLLPTYGLTGPTSTEYIGYVGVVGLTLAGVGLWVRSRENLVRFWAAMAVVTILLAMGQYTPLYGILFSYVPGLDLFRVPARWLMICSLSLAALASFGLDVPWEKIKIERRVLLGRLVAFGIGTVAVMLVLLPKQQMGIDTIPTQLVIAWACLAGLTLSLVAISVISRRRHSIRMWLGILAVCELIAASHGLEYSHPVPAEVYIGDRPILQHLNVGERGQRLLSIADTAFEPYDSHVLLEPYREDLSARELDAILINTKYHDVLSPNLPLMHGIPTVDGYDGGILPLRRYAEFKQLFSGAGQLTSDGLLRNQIEEIPSQRILQILGITHILTGRLDNIDVNTVPFDVKHSVELSNRQAHYQFSHVKPQHVTQISFVVSMSAGQEILQGQPTLRFRVYGSDGEAAFTSAAAGLQVADRRVIKAGSGSHGPPNILHTLKGDEVAVAVMDLHADGDLRPISNPIRASGVEVDLLTDVPIVRIHGITLIGPPSGTDSQPIFQPIALSDGDYLGLTMLPNQKLYEHHTALSRAYVVHSAWLAPDGNPTLMAMQNQAFIPGKDTVLSYIPEGSSPKDTHHRNGLQSAIFVLSRISKRWAPWLPFESPTDRVGSGFVSEEQLLSWGWQIKSNLGPNNRESATVKRWEIAPETESSKIGVEKAILVTDEPERLIVETRTDQPGILVLNDTFYPGWRAKLDGAPATLFRTNYFFRGVALPAGTHRVEFSYHPRAFWQGLLISILTLIVVVVTICRRLPWQVWRTDSASSRHG